MSSVDGRAQPTIVSNSRIVSRCTTADPIGDRLRADRSAPATAAPFNEDRAHDDAAWMRGYPMGEIARILNALSCSAGATGSGSVRRSRWG